MFYVQSGWVSSSTETAAHWLITALAIYFYCQKCQSPTAEQFGSECRWLSWKTFLFFLVFGTDKWDSRVSTRVVWAGVGVLKKLWGILVEFGGDLLLRVVRCSTSSMLTIFPFTSDSKAKCHSQPMPQCLPSLKQNNRWLDLEVSYLTYLAVLFCFLMVLGYELEVIPAALATSLLTEVKTAWFSHCYLPRLLLHMHLLCSEDPKLCM